MIDISFFVMGIIIVDMLFLCDYSSSMQLLFFYASFSYFWNFFQVKYGDALRRFTVNLRGHQFDYDVNSLRAKINDLFAINPSISYNLTYADEDGDLVTLVSDEEFREAIFGQRLNPLRINVKLTSDPLTTPSHTPTPQMGKSVNEALKSVPDPLRGVLSQLSQDLFLKTEETARGVTEFVEYFSKLGIPKKNTASERANSDIADGQAKFNFNESFISALITGLEELPKISGGQTSGSQPSNYPLIDVTEEIPKNSVGQTGGQLSQDLPVTYPIIGGMEELPKTADGQTSISQPSQDLPADLVKDEGTKADPSLPFMGFCPRVSLRVPSDSWQAFHQSDGAFRTFHRGVRCDGCGMHPIMGPRFKSTV